MSSPKRKQSDAAAEDDMPDQPLRYQSPLIAEEHIPSGCNSPRSRVAHRLEAMFIRDADHSGSPSPRKRAKLELSSSEGRQQQQQRGRSQSPSAQHDEGSPTTTSSDTPRDRRFRSPPPQSGDAVSVPTTNDNRILTWHMSEITGMDIDAQAGDDGEGLNGIGFRPTAQIAHARRQRRKQQISDWRNREARDARQRRFEQRQHGCQLHAKDDGGGGGGHVMRGRSVRFAEIS